MRALILVAEEGQLPIRVEAIGVIGEPADLHLDMTPSIRKSDTIELTDHSHELITPQLIIMAIT